MKHIYKRLTVLLLVFTLVVAAASASVAVKAVNLNESCSMTVGINNGGSYEDLSDAIDGSSALVDLYQIASADPDGNDGYTLSAASDLYGSLALDRALTGDAKTVERLAQEIAQLALKNISPDYDGYSLNTEISSLSPGLYLIVIRGADDEEYISKMKDDDGNTILATIVKTNSHVYIFSPVLVSLPQRDAAGEWLYDAQPSFKPEQSIRCGSLSIVEYLSGYVSGAPASFVFQVEGVLDGKSVYSDVVSMTFTEAGQKELTINNIPIGTEITVTQAYTGARYRLTSGAAQTATIAADTAMVSFTNEPSGKDLCGGITNRFEYNNGWEWTKIPHNS